MKRKQSFGFRPDLSLDFPNSHFHYHFTFIKLKSTTELSNNYYARSANTGKSLWGITKKEKEFSKDVRHFLRLQWKTNLSWWGQDKLIHPLLNFTFGHIDHIYVMCFWSLSQRLHSILLQKKKTQEFSFKRHTEARNYVFDSSLVQYKSNFLGKLCQIFQKTAQSSSFPSLFWPQLQASFCRITWLSSSQE